MKVINFDFSKDLDNSIVLKGDAIQIKNESRIQLIPGGMSHDGTVIFQDILKGKTKFDIEFDIRVNDPSSNPADYWRLGLFTSKEGFIDGSIVTHFNYYNRVGDNGITLYQNNKSNISRNHIDFEVSNGKVYNCKISYVNGYVKVFMNDVLQVEGKADVNILTDYSMILHSWNGGEWSRNSLITLKIIDYSFECKYLIRIGNELKTLKDEKLITIGSYPPKVDIFKDAIKDYELISILNNNNFDLKEAKILVNADTKLDEIEYKITPKPFILEQEQFEEFKDEYITGVSSINVDSKVSSTATVKVLINNGVGYNTFKNGEWKQVDNTIQSLIDNGMDIAEVNALTELNISKLDLKSKKIKFSIYVQLNNYSDDFRINNIKVNYKWE